MKQSFNLAVLVSSKGTGSNLKAIIEEGFEVKLVISNREDTAGIKIAQENKIPFEILPYQRSEDVSREKYRDRYSLQIGEILNSNKIDLVILAGFNRILARPYFETFSGTTINIHPGGVPDKKGESYRFEDGTIAPWNKSMMTEAAVVNFLTLKFATSTIHIVTEEADFGPVLYRAIVSVKRGDTVDSLYARLKKQEHKALIEVLKRYGSASFSDIIR